MVRFERNESPLLVGFTRYAPRFFTLKGKRLVWYLQDRGGSSRGENLLNEAERFFLFFKYFYDKIILNKKEAKMVRKLLLSFVIIIIPFISTCIDYGLESEETSLETKNPEEPSKTLYSDTFIQETVEAVDILWVIDNSCSMGEEVNFTTANYPMFMQFFIDTGLDYHIAIVSTDMDAANQRGKFIGNPKIITPATPDPVTAFSNNAHMLNTPNGSATERGLDAAYTALNEPLISNENSGFLRDDALLFIIVISDEPDQSRNVTVSEFVSWLDTIKGPNNEELSSLSAVVGLDPNSLTPSYCSSSHGTADPGLHYYDVANQTGGIVYSICEEDWDPILTSLGLEASGLKKQFFLSKIPVIDTINVTVEGVAESRWTYNSTSNSILFDDDAVPDEGEVIVVEYILRENY